MNVYWESASQFFPQDGLHFQSVVCSFLCGAIQVEKHGKVVVFIPDNYNDLGSTHSFRLLVIRNHVYYLVGYLPLKGQNF